MKAGLRRDGAWPSEAPEATNADKIEDESKEEEEDDDDDGSSEN